MTDMDENYRISSDDVGFYDEEIDELRRTVEKLRAALKPFANCDLGRSASSNDNLKVTGDWPNDVTLGDFRRAHDVLYPPSVK